jgi:uracil-DNA glycosylase family 4
MSRIAEINERVIACTRCPRLVIYRQQVAVEKKKAFRDWTYWGKPVPSFGDPHAEVLIVGLAPGAHGSNRTGRPFTGDASGDFLYPALYRAGFASQPTAVGRDDGMVLHNCLITAAARCAPPDNKPTPQELRNCFPYLVEEFEALARLKVVIAFGSIAFKSCLDLFAATKMQVEPQKPKFGHAIEALARGKRDVHLISSYHPSRQNTNTGVLTQAMFDAIFTRANALVR